MYSDSDRVIIAAVKLFGVTRSDAEHWFKHEVIASLGMSAEKAVEQGHVEAVLAYIQCIADGGYA